MCRRRAGQEWQASGFGDSTGSRKRRGNAGADGSKFSSGKKRFEDEDAGGDFEAHVDDANADCTSAAVQSEGNVEQQPVEEFIVPVKAFIHDSNGSICDLSFGANSANFSSEPSLMSSINAPAASCDALSPIDNVPSFDSGAAAARLETSFQSFSLPLQADRPVSSCELKVGSGVAEVVPFQQLDDGMCGSDFSMQSE